MSIVEHQQINN